jgi:hypothetical protein
MRSLPPYGIVGGLILAAGFGANLLTESLFFHTFFTPWMWTGYLLLADALVARLTGRSWLTPEPRRFLGLLPISCMLWLIFEGYNLHLRNWQYIGLPAGSLAETIGYLWSFATIWPALFITADLLEAFGLKARGRPLTITPGRLRIWFRIGLVAAIGPLLLPGHLATYTFAIVWVAFVFLLEPLIYRWPEVPSLLREAGEGVWTRWISLGLGGLLCGFIWESLNALSTARWVYIFPLFQNWKLFEMPLPGFLGFIPFAWEASAMYAFWLLARSAHTGRKTVQSRPGSG